MDKFYLTDTTELNSGKQSVKFNIWSVSDISAVKLETSDILIIMHQSKHFIL